MTPLGSPCCLLPFTQSTARHTQLHRWRRRDHHLPLPGPGGSQQQPARRGQHHGFVTEAPAAVWGQAAVGPAPSVTGALQPMRATGAGGVARGGGWWWRLQQQHAPCAWPWARCHELHCMHGRCRAATAQACHMRLCEGLSATYLGPACPYLGATTPCVCIWSPTRSRLQTLPLGPPGLLPCPAGCSQAPTSLSPAWTATLLARWWVAAGRLWAEQLGLQLATGPCSTAAKTCPSIPLWLRGPAASASVLARIATSHSDNIRR